MHTPQGPRPRHGQLGLFGREGPGVGGAVPNKQTAQAGEVYAALAAATLTQGRLHLVTDSQYVEGTINRGAGHLGWQKGPFALVWRDVWKPCAPHGPQAVWIKSHITREEAKTRGFPDDHWLGNDRADAKATECCKANVSDDQTCTTRSNRQEACGHVHMILGTIWAEVIGCRDPERKPA